MKVLIILIILYLVYETISYYQAAQHVKTVDKPPKITARLPAQNEMINIKKAIDADKQEIAQLTKENTPEAQEKIRQLNTKIEKLNVDYRNAETRWLELEEYYANQSRKNSRRNGK